MVTPSCVAARLASRLSIARCRAAAFARLPRRVRRRGCGGRRPARTRRRQRIRWRGRGREPRLFPQDRRQEGYRRNRTWISSPAPRAGTGLNEACPIARAGCSLVQKSRQGLRARIMARIAVLHAAAARLFGARACCRLRRRALPPRQAPVPANPRGRRRPARGSMPFSSRRRACPGIPPAAARKPDRPEFQPLSRPFR